MKYIKGEICPHGIVNMMGNDIKIGDKHCYKCNRVKPNFIGEIECNLIKQ